MLQSARFRAFTVSELLMENQQVGGRGKITIPPPQPRLKPSLTGLSITSKICLPPSAWGKDTMMIRLA